MISEITSEDLKSIVHDIFGSMAGMEIIPSTSCIAADNQGGYLASAVQIVGEWQGAVRLDFDMELARQACANLLNVEPSELTLQDIGDAVGELANIVGGSVKASRAPNSGLSLPSVVVGHDFELSIAQGKVVQAVSFSHPSGALTVSVIERPVG